MKRDANALTRALLFPSSDKTLQVVGLDKVVSPIERKKALRTRVLFTDVPLSGINIMFKTKTSFVASQRPSLVQCPDRAHTLAVHWVVLDKK